MGDIDGYICILGGKKMKGEVFISLRFCNNFLVFILVGGGE